VNPRALVLAGFGINCDYETAAAFEMAGAAADRIHLNDLIAQPKRFEQYQIFAIPGGFSFGDDVASGKILANRIRFRLGDALNRFVDNGNLAIGICNGFQVMAKMGLLPRFKPGFMQDVTLTHNDSGRFEDRWTYLRSEPGTRCVWLRDVERLELPVRHGEGKFIPRDEEVLRTMLSNGQVALRYRLPNGDPADGAFPANPNGSIADIAGICDPTGRVFGLMPHPEAFVVRTQHPRWTRLALPAHGAGLRLFQNAVDYAKGYTN
jgi:phosphoribosylformylglycinamidine synthase subunit PurQ / glutaminase